MYSLYWDVKSAIIKPTGDTYVKELIKDFVAENSIPALINLPLVELEYTLTAADKATIALGHTLLSSIGEAVKGIAARASIKYAGKLQGT